MAEELHSCDACTRGCEANRTEERTREEVSAGPYLLFAAIVILLASIAAKWLFF